MPEGSKAGYPVFWREFGTGPVPALLLHCALAHSKAWSRMADMLGDNLKMVAPDMLGHGRSADPDLTQPVDDQIFRVSAEFFAPGSHLIGHSFGAVIALRLALEHPERVRSLTLIEPVLFVAAGESDPVALKAYLAQAAAFANAMDREAWPEAAEAFTEIWGDGRAWDSVPIREQALLAEKMPFIRATQAPLAQDTASLLSQSRLEQMSCPTLLIRGSNSNPVIPAIHATLARRIPQAEEHTIPGAGHMAPISHPADVASVLHPFLMAT